MIAASLEMDRRCQTVSPSLARSIPSTSLRIKDHTGPRVLLIRPLDAPPLRSSNETTPTQPPIEVILPTPLRWAES